MLSHKRLSLRKKINLFLVGATLFIFSTSFVFLWILQRNTVRQTFADSNLAIAQMIGHESLAFLKSGDSSRLNDRLGAIPIPGIQSIYVFDKEGRLFSLFEKQGYQVPAHLPPQRVQYRNASLHVVDYITEMNQVAGTVYLRVSTRLVDRSINRMLVVVFVSFGAIVAILTYLAFHIQRQVSAPILRLAEAAKNIPETSGFSVAVKEGMDDEIAILYSGFDKMLGKIERREAQRDHAEQALRESEHRYKSLVESSPDAILLVREDSILYANQSALVLTGYDSPEALQQVRFSAIVIPNDQTAEGIRKAIPLEAALTRKDGYQVHVELTSAETMYQGAPAVQYVIRDVTESKRLREVSVRMERLAALGEFSAMLAHEMRNCIGSIALSVRTLSEHLEVPEEHRDNVENIERAVHRIQQIIKGVLDFARPAPPQLSNVEINKLLDTSIHLVEAELKHSGIVVERNFDSSGPSVAVDPDQISQAFVNLLLNSKQAITGGGKITVSTLRRGEEVHVGIQDTGRGIPSENLGKIFNPFFTTTPRGVGLGLAYVSRILEQHGAQITVESTPGHGTLFILNFRSQKKEV